MIDDLTSKQKTKLLKIPQNENLSNNLKNDNNNYYDEGTKNIIEENENLLSEIDNLKKEINLSKNKLAELNNEYNKLKKEYQDNLSKNLVFENKIKEKDIGDEFNKLDEEKYKLKLKYYLEINNLIKERNRNIIKHNEQMKKFYKIYTGKNWNNAN